MIINDKSHKLYEREKSMYMQSKKIQDIFKTINGFKEFRDI